MPDGMGMKRSIFRVLCVDDSVTSRAALAASLARQPNVEVDVVGHPNEAMAKAKAAASTGRPYNLFVLDINLEGMSGFELLAQIRTFKDYGATAAVFVSGSQEQDLDSQAGALGAKLFPKTRFRELHELFQQFFSAMTVVPV